MTVVSATIHNLFESRFAVGFGPGLLLFLCAQISQSSDPAAQPILNERDSGWLSKVLPPASTHLGSV